MNQSSNLLIDPPNDMRSSEMVTPFPATNACYRSRVYNATAGVNPLAAACDQIMSLAIILSSSKYPDDREKLLEDLAHEIRSFEHKAQIANYQNNTILAARFALCCLLDETIKATEWGQRNNWFENNLLSLFHKENCGDTRFFAIIDKALENIPANLHLIELLYLCLNLGSATSDSDHEESSHEQNEIVAITNKLYQIAAQHNQYNHKNIFIQDKKIEQEIKNRDNLQESKPKANNQKLFWATTILAFAFSGIMYLGINFKLNSISKPAITRVEQIIKNKSDD